MSRLPSFETQIRNLKRELREAYAELAKVKTQAAHHSARAHAWHAEVREWKERFDALLSTAHITIDKEPTQ